MKKRISFKLFRTVVWRGVCQMAESVGKLFGYKGEGSFAKVVWRIFAGCGALLLLMFTSVMLYGFITEIVIDEFAEAVGLCKKDPWKEIHISNNVVHQRFYNAKSRLYNEATGKVMIEGLDWVVTSDDKDTLAVFAKDGKRGYVNRFTGEIAIPAQYTRAWVFCEGLAAVEKERQLVFIDHSGNVVIDKGFEVYFNDDAYGFKNGYCIIRDKVTGKFGLIDRKGDWVLEPEFDNIHPMDSFVRVYKDDLEGLYSIKMEEMFAVQYQEIYMTDSTIIARGTDDIAAIYDLEGNVLHPMVIDDVEVLEYPTKKYHIVQDEEEGELIDHVYAVANCMSYKVGATYARGHYGLLSPQGKRLTPPIYTKIEAIAANRYLCFPQGVILDDNGREVKQ